MSLRSLLTPSLLAPPLLGVLAAACTTPAAYPSLLPRAAEKQSFAEPAPAAPAALVADPALDTRIAAASRTLDERVAAFDAAAGRAARQNAAARGSPAGSEAWLDAQVALAELDTMRSSTQEIVTDLEEAASERATSLAPEYPALEAAVTRARTAAEAQTARIAELQRALAPA